MTDVPPRRGERASTPPNVSGEDARKALEPVFRNAAERERALRRVLPSLRGQLDRSPSLRRAFEREPHSFRRAVERELGLEEHELDVEEHERSLVPSDEGTDSTLGNYEPNPLISATLAKRLRSLARKETKNNSERVFTAGWTEGAEINGLIVAHRTNGHAFGSARQIAELDKAFRRAAALIEKLSSGEPVEEWPRPIHPRRGGLQVLDARHGSLDILWTFYGGLVAVAASTPVSLASFASLAWDTSKYSYGLARRWFVRPLLSRELRDRPDAGHGSYLGEEEPWQERTTKKLMPLLRQAIDSGQGLDFQVTGQDGEIRLIVPPVASVSESGRSSQMLAGAE